MSSCSTLNKNTHEPKVFYKSDVSDEIFADLYDALQVTNNSYQTGFQNEHGEFVSKMETPIFDSSTIEGTVQKMMKNGYLKTKQIAPNIFEATDSYAAEILHKELLMNHYNKFQKKGNTFELGDFNPVLPKEASPTLKLHSDIANTYFEMKDNSEKPREVLYDKEQLFGLIQEFMKKIGFSTESIERYKGRTQDKFGVEPNAEALIDMNLRIIAFQNGEITLDALGEEFSHFVVEAWNQDDINRMLSTINNTTEYVQYAEQYREIYSKQHSDPAVVEQYVRKEVLGKMLNASLQSDFTLDNRTDTEVSFFQKLAQIVRDFFGFVATKVTEQRVSEIDAFARNIRDLLYNEQLEKNLNLNPDSAIPVMYSLVETAVHRDLSDLYSRLNTPQFRSSLDKNKMFNESMDVFVTTLREATRAKKMLQENDGVVSHATDVFVQNVLQSENLLTAIRSLMSKNHAAVDADTYKIFTDTAYRTMDAMNQLKGDYQNLKSNLEPVEVSVAMAEKYGTEEDVSATRKMMMNAKTALSEIFRDTNFFVKMIGHVSKTSMPMVSLLSKVIDSSYNMYIRNFNADVKIFGKPLFAIKEQLDEFLDGVYVKSIANNEKLDKDRKQYELSILKQVSPSTYKDMTIEQYSAEYNTLPRPEKNGDDFYHYDYLYKKGLGNQKWESQKKRDYYADFIDTIDQIIQDEETPWATSFYKTKINESQKRKYDPSYSRDSLEDRRRQASPFNNSGLRKGLSMVKYGTVLKQVADGKLNENQVVSTSSMLTPFSEGKEGYTQPKREDYVIVGDVMDEEALLTFRTLQFNNINYLKRNVKDAKSNLTVGQKREILNENFKKAFDDKVESTSGMTEMDQRKALKKWLDENISFEMTDEYWSSMDKSGIDFDSFYSKISGDRKVTMEGLEKEYAELQLNKQSLIKVYKIPNDFKEIDVERMSEFDKARILSIEEQLRTKRVAMSDMFKDAEIEMYKQGDGEVNIQLNQSFDRIYEEKIGKSFNDSDLTEIKNFFKDQNIGMTAEQYNRFLEFEKTVKKNPNSQMVEDYKDKTLNANREIGLSNEGILKTYLIENAPIWYRRYDSDLDYSDFIRDYNNIAFDMVEFVNTALLSSTNDIVYQGKPIQMMRVTPSFKYSLPVEEDTAAIYERYKNASTNQEKFDILQNELGGLEDVDSSYKTDFGQIKNNADKLSAYLMYFDARLSSLEKYDMLDKRYIFMRPQKRKTGLERFEAFTKKGDKKGQIEDYLKEMFLYREDDLEEAWKNDANESANKIPKYGFIKLTADELSESLFEDIMWDLKNANHYESKVKHWGDANELIMAFENVEFNKGQKAVDTNYYYMMKEMRDFNFYGKTTSNRVELEIPFIGKTVDISKLLFGFKSLGVRFALAMSPITALTNVTSGITANTIMALTGRNIYSTSNKRALAVMAPLLTSSIKDIGEFSPETKLNKILYNFGVYDLSDRYRNTNYNKYLRLGTEAEFAMMGIGNYGMQTQVALSKLMEIRLIDGQFVNWRQYSTREKVANPSLRNEEIKAKFDSYQSKSMYDYLNEDAEFNEEQLRNEGYKGSLDKDYNIVMSSIKNVAEQTTMEIANHHEGVGARDPRWSFILTLKKWLVIANNNMFSRKRYDYDTGGYEEGLLFSYKYFFDLFKKIAKEKQSLSDAYGTMDELEQKNIKANIMTTSILAFMMGIAMMLKKAADDDDEEKNYGLQLASYMALRNVNELFSGTVGVGNSLYEAIQQPIMTASVLSNAVNLVKLGDIGETVESGVYKGQDKYWSSVMKFTWLKNPYGVSSADVISEKRKSYEYFTTQNSLFHVLSLLPKTDRSN